MILDLLEIWAAVVVAFVAGAFAGALLHDWLARGRLSVGQAAFAEVVAMGVEGGRSALALRRARMIREEEARARGRQPVADQVRGEPSLGQLDRIRGIEPSEVAQLAKAGYGRLDQVARWSDAEQAWIAGRMAVSRRRVGRWTRRAQTILRREQAMREALPRPVRASKRAKKHAVAETAAPVAQPPAQAARATPTESAVSRSLPPAPPAEPSPKGGVVPARSELTPYEIALDLELRKP